MPKRSYEERIAESAEREQKYLDMAKQQRARIKLMEKKQKDDFIPHEVRAHLQTGEARLISSLRSERAPLTRAYISLRSMYMTACGSHA